MDKKLEKGQIVSGEVQNKSFHFYKPSLKMNQENFAVSQNPWPEAPAPKSLATWIIQPSKLSDKVFYCFIAA